MYKRLVKAKEIVTSLEQVKELIPYYNHMEITNIEDVNNANMLIMDYFADYPQEAKILCQKYDYKQIWTFLTSKLPREEKIWKDTVGTIDDYLKLTNLQCHPHSIKVVNNTDNVHYKHTADANANCINVNFRKDKYFHKQVFDHEIGHVLSNSCPELEFAINSNYGDIWGKYNIKKRCFVGVFSYTPEETWADAYAYYINRPSWLQSKHPEIYKVVNHIVSEISNHDEIRSAYYEEFSNVIGSNVDDF